MPGAPNLSGGDLSAMKHSFRVLNTETEYSSILLLGITLIVVWLALQPFLGFYTIIIQIFLLIGGIHFYSKNRIREISLDDEGICILSRSGSSFIRWDEIKAAAHIRLRNEIYGHMSLTTEKGIISVPLYLSEREGFINLFNSKSGFPIETDWS